MEGIVDDILRQGDLEARSKLPQIPPKLIPNPRIAPTSQGAVSMTTQKEAPQQGASIFIKKPPDWRLLTQAKF